MELFQKMAGFLMKQMVGNQLNEVTGAFGSSNDAGGEKTETGEDPEVVAARLEQEERRKEKHRKMEAEREKMREGIRGKYQIKKKEEGPSMDFMEGRIGGPRKTPEANSGKLGEFDRAADELAAERQAEEDSLIGQLGLTEHVEKAKTFANSALESVKGFLPFGK